MVDAPVSEAGAARRVSSSLTVGTNNNFINCPNGGMVDALDSKLSVERRVGSSPTLGTL